MHSSVVPYNKVTCDCGLELCKKIGYCQRGRFTLPVDDKKRQAWFDMAGMKVDAYDQTNSLNDKKKKNYLAYWHFPPDRRKYDAERQTWSLIDAEESHKPNPTKSYDFLVPSYPLGEFIVDVRAARRSSQRSQSGRERRSLDASSPPAISAGSADLQRAVQQSARADAAEEDAAASRRRERELLEAAGSQSMVEVVDALKGAGVRVEADLRNEKINYKVREHSLAKVPNLLVLGKREAEERTVALRRLGSQGQEVVALDSLVERLRAEATPPDLAGNVA